MYIMADPEVLCNTNTVQKYRNHYSTVMIVFIFLDRLCIPTYLDICWFLYKV